MGEGKRKRGAAERRASSRSPSSSSSISTKPPRGRLTVQLSGPLVERLRNAVYWTPGLTITRFMERCIGEVVDRLEEERGERFPRRTGELSPGRPQK